MKLHVHHRYHPRLQDAASRILSAPDLPYQLTLNLLPHRADEQDQPDDQVTIEAQYYLGIAITDQFDNLDHQQVAAILVQADPSIMAGYHATMMSSLWTYFRQPYHHHPAFYADLAAQGRRISWMGTPYVQADRWELPDGSAFVVYADRIHPAVHRERIDLIAADYSVAARKSLRRATEQAETNGNYRGDVPLVPHSAFAPANDGLLRHEAALPLEADRCWCRFPHQITSTPNIIDY